MPKDYTYSVWWNLLIITVGCLLFAVGAKGVVVHHGFITGGVYGISLLLNYSLGMLDPGIWYFILNVPLFIMGWFLVSRRFFWYSLYATVVTSLASAFITMDLGVNNQLYAAVAGGVICGAGGGMMLRSLGSGGGLDVIAIILNNRYNFGVGRFYMCFNAVLFSLTALRLEADLLISSLILVFISSTVVDKVLSLFSQRKMVYIISNKSHEVAREILDGMGRGATFLKGVGAYTGQDRDILLTVVNNIQLKRLEELVFTLDPNAMFIVENTFNVLGHGFARRKIY